jgi:hypothetical protein
MSNDDAFRHGPPSRQGGGHPRRHFHWRERRAPPSRVAKRPENKPARLIVTIACSTGERYLSTPLAAEAKAEVGG